MADLKGSLSISVDSRLKNWELIEGYRKAGTITVHDGTYQCVISGKNNILEMLKANVKGD